MNIKYADLLDEVLPSLLADPSDPVTENAIKRSVIELCQSAWIWKHLIEPTDVAAGEVVHDLEVPAGAVVAQVLSVALDGERLKPQSIDWLDHTTPDWHSAQGMPVWFTQTNTQQIVLVPAPASDMPAALTATLALMPSKTATTFPQWIADRYLYVLADGALSKLMLMPGRPWSDMAGGADRRMRFEAGIANARAAAVADLGRAPMRVRTQH